jgi:hypothetical protein
MNRYNNALKPGIMIYIYYSIKYRQCFIKYKFTKFHIV